MKVGNIAILEHRASGRSLRVFWGSKGTVTYAGEFELCDDTRPPYYWVDQPIQGQSGTRRVLQFRLRPVGVVRQVEPTGTRPVIEPPRPISSQYRVAVPIKGARPPRPFEIDPDKIDRALKGHADTQDRLAEICQRHGFDPCSPGPGDPNFDLAWRCADGSSVVVEVKSLTAANEAGQLRLGLGQVLDFADALRRSGTQSLPVLAVEAQPRDSRWVEICANCRPPVSWGHFDVSSASVMGPLVRQ